MKIHIIVLIALASVSCAVQPSGPVLEFTSKQQHYSQKVVGVLEWGRFSDDPYDSFRELRLLSKQGLKIDIGVPDDYDRSKLRTPSVRALPFFFTCDYSKDELSGEISFSYRDPRNLYNHISAVVKVQCIPLSANEIAKIKTDEHKEKERLLEQIRHAERLENERQLTVAKQQEQEQREEQEAAIRLAAEQKRKNTPEYKRELAKAQIIDLRAALLRIQALIDEEKRVAAVSGYQDARKLYDLGRETIFLENRLNEAWEVYIANGGTEKTLFDLH